MKFLYYSSLLLTTLLLLISSSCWGSDLENELHHVLDIASHLSTSVCQRTPSPGLKKRQSSAVVEVIHRHGPCADEQLLNSAKSISQPSMAEILRNDQSRVKFIQKRGLGLGRGQGGVRFPISTGYSLNTGNYIVTMGLGTPETNHFLMLDTGSDLTWTQCQPCSLSCHRQYGPIFDPYKSSSYSDNSCNSSECSASASPFLPVCSLTNKCTYTATYADGAVTTGFLGKDKLTIAPNETFPDFAFGCSLFNEGYFGHTSGLLGLGSGPISLVSQTAKKYGGCFSYCLPSTSSSKGFLLLGRDYDHTTRFTPLIHSQEYPTLYMVNTIAIVVEGRNLLSVTRSANNMSIHTFVDSGTVITRLPSDVYKALSSEFRRVMRTKYRYKGAFYGYYDGFLDTCFVPNSNKIHVPSVSFTFQNNVQVNLDASGTLYVVNKSLICFAFTNGGAGLTIFGNTQQKTFEVVYDVAGQKLGFSSGGMCT